MNRSLAPVALLVVGLAAGFFAASAFSRGELSPAEGVQIKVATIYDESETYSIRAGYPQFGMPKADAAVRGSVEEAIAQFKEDAAGPLVTSAKNEFIGIFNSAYVGADVVSIELIHSFYTGGAHPNALVEGLNFDRASGKELTLDDALAMIGLTLEQVAEKANSELKKKLGEVMFPEGAEAKPENYSTFIVREDKVTFVFQSYQVAAYAAGPQEVSFDRKD